VRPVYSARRDATIAALAEDLPDARWLGEAAGLHLHVRLPEWVDELELAARAFERGAPESHIGRGVRRRRRRLRDAQRCLNVAT
jgi:DNA-binding transcriptional MocR family regulator